MSNPDTGAASSSTQFNMTQNAKKRKLMPNAMSDAHMVKSENYTAREENEMPKKSNESALLRLPNEIKQRIWIIVVKENEPIIPIQLKDRSNKFLWSRSQIVKGEKVVGAVPGLAAVKLAKVCRAIYEEVALTHLFYQFNTFDLSAYDTIHAITYLVALTDARLKAIRSMRIELCLHVWAPHQAKLFTLLRVCDGLQHIGLVIRHYHKWKGYRRLLEQLSGVKDLVAALQGPKKFVVILTSCMELAPDDVPHGKSACEEVKKYLQAQLQLNENTAVSLRKLRSAKEVARLDIHGEGRLSRDKKPGVVSSRTRQGVKNAEAMDADGTLPTYSIAKYDSAGSLNWYICEVLSVREAESDDEIPQLEFHTECLPYARGFRVNYDDEPTISWEAATVLMSPQAQEKIVDFYKKHPNALGLRTIHMIWGVDPSDSNSRHSISRLIQDEDAVEAERKATAAKEMVKEEVKNIKAKVETKTRSKGTTGRQAGKPNRMGNGELEMRFQGI